MIRKSVVSSLSLAGMFWSKGVYVLFDGQFGSTGKGLAADLLEQYDHKINCHVDVVGTNAGPNSGHTAILEDGSRVFTQQIPVFSACRGLRSAAKQPMTMFNGGAILDMVYVDAESKQYNVSPVIHSSAAMITEETVGMFSSDSLDKIASTGKGVGQAMAAKVLRVPGATYGGNSGYPYAEIKGNPDYCGNVVLLECAQGFSLGINSGFYPYTTSRECGASQALADAGASPRDYQGGMMVVRTYPIRVGSTDKGDSGPCFPDQTETSWEALNLSRELTSVTKRVRRVFTFSMMQFEMSYRANRPSVVLLNFCNYMTDPELEQLTTKIRHVLDHGVELLMGFGPKTSQVITHHDWLNGRRTEVEC